MNSGSFWAVMAGLLLAGTNFIAAAETPFDPVQDDPKLPRVLLIGDSISIGYTIPVQHLLKGQANVHRIPVNGQYSAYGLANLKAWLGNEHWDVIHFNWGIWDTHMLNTNGEYVPDKDERPGVDRMRATVPEYQENLEKIIDILEPTGAKLIWATTTPVTCRKGDRYKDIARYNRAAEIVMKSRLVRIDDLYASIEPRLSELQSDDGCHFNPRGCDYLAGKVADSILACLTPQTERVSEFNAEPAGEQLMEDRHVVRFEHDCLEKWGYTNKLRQYFYVVEPKRKWDGPLMVCLHSAGGDAKTELAPNAKFIADAGDDFTGIVLNSGPDSEWWWGWNEIKANPDKYSHALTPVENRVLATIEWVVQKYRIDRSRIYMRGISMGGSGTLGIGMAHGEVFAALLAGVPAGTSHALYRLNDLKASNSRIDGSNEIPPVFVFFSQKDDWSKGMEDWLDLMSNEKLYVLAAWGPWGHANHYEMTNPGAYQFPWLSIRRNQAYPVFATTSSDDKYPGYHSDAPDQNGQISAYFRWAVLDDEPGRFAIELRLVQDHELRGSVNIPTEVITDVTLRRLQKFAVESGKSFSWKIEQDGHLVDSGLVTADGDALLTIPKVKITAAPIDLYFKQKLTGN